MRMLMLPDLAKYRTHVDHYDMTDAQKNDLIHSVYRMFENAVARAFGDDPTQLSGAQLGSKDAPDIGDVITLAPSDYQNLNKTFNTAKGDA